MADLLFDNLYKKVQEYTSLPNDEKVTSDKYNIIMTEIVAHEKILEEYRDKLNNINSNTKPKKTNSKSIYNKKSFINDMNMINEIKESINNDNIDELMELYNKLSEIQKRIVPYLESQKIEIIKL